MAHAIVHAELSVDKWGGEIDDYLAIHEWLDEPKYWIGHSLHRMFRHHSEGIKEAEAVFGKLIINKDSKRIFVKYICEEHIKEDCDNYIPSAKEWLQHVQSGKKALWMRKTKQIQTKGNLLTNEQKENNLG